MGTENIHGSALDAPRSEAQPTAPPATHIDASMIPEQALEHLDRFMSQADRDKLEAARIAGREVKRAAQQKAREEDAASSKRAKDAVDALVKQDAIEPESEKPAPGGPPVALAVPPLLTASQQPIVESYTASMGEIAAEIGMPAEEAQTLLDFVIGGATQTLDGLDTSNKEEVITHMHSIYGEATDGIIAGAQARFKKLPEGVQMWLDRTTEDGQCLANHPSVLVMLSLWNGGYSKLTPEAAAKELAQHRATKEYLAGDRLKLEKVRLLTMIATRGQDGAEMPMPAKAAPAAKSAVQKEIDAIRKNPDYIGLDSRKRAPLVARMGRLMSQPGVGDREGTGRG
jgi:hypothetical protein